MKHDLSPSSPAKHRPKGAGHRQRLRDKFLDQGLDSFTDSEVLELILTLGTPRKDCKDLARTLLKEFGGLAAALEAPQVRLQQIKGIGPNNAFALHFVHGVARRYLKHRLKDKEYVRSSREVADYLIHAMRDLKKEVLIALFLDASHAIIDIKVVAEGTLTSNTIYPRELIKMALDHHAAAVVIAHNHPSGNQSPSVEDRRLTRNLFLAMSFVSIRLLDHFIVAGSGLPYSFADHGIMAEITADCAKVMG